MSAEINTFYAIGVVNEEPKLRKLDNGKLMARTILAVYDRNNLEVKHYLPLTAFNKKARILTNLCHRGSTIYVKCTISTDVTTTSIQAKQLISVTFRVIDMVVLKREPMACEDLDFADVIQLYDPETFMDIGEENND